MLINFNASTGKFLENEEINNKILFVKPCIHQGTSLLKLDCKGGKIVDGGKTLRSIIILFVLLLMVVLIPGARSATAAEDKYVNIPIPQDFIPARKADGTPQYISDAVIEDAIRKFSPKMKKFHHNKFITQFIVPNHVWLKQLLEGYDQFLSVVGVRAKADMWDCENYSGMLNSLTTLQIWRAGYLDTRAAIGWIKVAAKKEWAGLPGALHALMFAVTDKGIFIIEPQNGQYISLSDYPNRQYIEEVFLF